MGFWNWIRFRRQKPAETPSSEAPQTSGCVFCADPVHAALIDLGVVGPKDCFLLQCPKCEQYWGGHGYQLHYRWAFTPEEAAEHFPGIRDRQMGTP